MNRNLLYKQYGAALITSLLMVLVISILGVAVGLQVSSLRKVSTVNYDSTISFSNAESALAEAESFMSSNSTDTDTLVSMTVAINSGASWWKTDSNWISGTTVSNVTEPSVYLIEDAGYDGDDPCMNCNDLKRHFYRITAKGDGKGDAVSYIQTYYGNLE